MEALTAATRETECHRKPCQKFLKSCDRREERAGNTSMIDAASNSAMVSLERVYCPLVLWTRMLNIKWLLI